MYFNYRTLSNQKVAVFRYGSDVEDDGLVRKGNIQLLILRGSVQPAKSLINLKKKYGEQVESGVFYSSTIKNKLNIETRNTSADVIYWNGFLWKVQSSIVHRLVLDHTESDGILITHPPEELARYLPVYLQVNDEGDVLIDRSGNRLTFGLRNFTN